MDRGLTRTHSSISAPGILVVCNTLSCGCAMALSVRKLLACAPKGVQRGRRGVIRRALALCQGFGGVLGACNAPLQRFAVMVQRNAAGSLRVSLNFTFISPKIEDPPQEEWGIKGVERRSGDSGGGHSPRYVTAIPSRNQSIFVRMTKEGTGQIRDSAVCASAGKSDPS